MEGLGCSRMAEHRGRGRVWWGLWDGAAIVEGDFCGESESLGRISVGSAGGGLVD